MYLLVPRFRLNEPAARHFFYLHLFLSIDPRLLRSLMCLRPGRKLVPRRTRAARARHADY